MPQLIMLVMAGMFYIMYIALYVGMIILATSFFSFAVSTTSVFGGVLRKFFIAKPLRVLFKSLDKNVSEEILTFYLAYVKKRDKKKLTINLIALGLYAFAALIAIFNDLSTRDNETLATFVVFIIVIAVILGMYMAYKTFVFNEEHAEDELYKIWLLEKYLSEEQILAYISEVNLHLKENHKAYIQQYYSMNDYPIDHKNEIGFAYYQTIKNKDFSILEKYSTKYFRTYSLDDEQETTATLGEKLQKIDKKRALISFLIAIPVVKILLDIHYYLFDEFMEYRSDTLMDIIFDTDFYLLLQPMGIFITMIFTVIIYFVLGKLPKKEIVKVPKKEKTLDTEQKEIKAISFSLKKVYPICVIASFFIIYILVVTGNHNGYEFSLYAQDHIQEPQRLLLHIIFGAILTAILYSIIWIRNKIKVKKLK